MLSRKTKSRMMGLSIGSLALLLISCGGTTIPVTVDSPSAYPLQRGARLNITSSAESRPCKKEVEKAAAYASQIVSRLGCYQLTGSANCNYSLEYWQTGQAQDHIMKYSARLYPYGAATGSSNLRDYYMHRRADSPIRRRSLEAGRLSAYIRLFGENDYALFAREGLMIILPYALKIDNFSVSASGDNPELKQAVADSKRGDWDAAEQHARAALAAHPNDAESHYMMGIISVQRRQFDEAERYVLAADAITHRSKYADAIKTIRDCSALHQRAKAQWANLGISGSPFTIYDTETL